MTCEGERREIIGPFPGAEDAKVGSCLRTVICEYEVRRISCELRKWTFIR